MLIDTHAQQLVVTYRMLVGDNGNFYGGLLDWAAQGCDPGLDRPLTAEQSRNPANHTSEPPKMQAFPLSIALSPAISLAKVTSHH